MRERHDQNEPGMTLRIRLSLLLAGLALLAGCATKPQPPMDLRPFAGGTSQKVGVALAELPKASMDYPGTDCLLCFAAAQLANAPLAKQVDTFDAEQLKPVRDRIADSLRRKGVNAVVIAEPIVLESLAQVSGDTTNKPHRDFRPLKARYGVDKLVVVSVDALGIQRLYSGFAPVTDPRAYVRGTGYMVDLASNTYEWYQPFRVFRPAEGRWNEPPEYPGLTNAYLRALEASQDRLLQPWSF
jgi:hypothetical protein